MGHGSHGSHGNHTSHGNHGNTDTHTNTLSSGSISGASEHTSTIGGVDWSGSFSSSTKLGVMGSTGSLSQLTNIANNMRSRVKDSTYADYVETNTAGNGGSLPSSGSQITAAAASNLLNYSGAQYAARYQPYTLSLDVTTEGADSAVTVPTTSKNQSVTGEVTGSGDYDKTSWTSTATGKKGTSSTYTFTDSLQGVKVVDSSTYPKSIPQITTGSKITKAQAEAILKVLEDSTLVSRKGPAAKSGSWSGSNKMAHSNSHASHSSHSSY